MIIINLEEDEDMRVIWHDNELSDGSLKVLNAATELALTPIDERGDVYEV